MELNEKTEIEESIPEGYWKSKIGIIPNDWRCIKIGEILKIKHGKSQKKVEVPNGKYPILASGGIIGWTDEFLCNKPSVLIGRKGTIDKPKYFNTPFWTVDTLFYSEFKIDCCEKFFYYVFDSINWYRYNEASGVPSLSARTIESIFVQLPSKEEQIRIVKILSTQDKIIHMLEQLIEKKVNVKKYLMQVLLNYHSEYFKQLDGFSGEWRNVLLNKVVENKVRKVNKPLNGYWRLGLRSHGKGTFHEFITNPETNAMDILYEVKENDLIANITFAWEHAITIANKRDENKLVSHRFPTYEFINDNVPEFFKFFILRDKFKKQLQDISPGGAGRNRVMSKKDFLKLNVTIPDPEEQLEIARILSAIDEEIKLLNDEFEQQIKKKKSLMQLLLTGKVRTTNMS
ncbi:MAG: restriction endonuclease subunit S [Maledivibacter sp.]|jgi:type I restriction enzyme S subunit|nr:restriction endonuclease subunit S [Maledivibacter sp.]